MMAKLFIRPDGNVEGLYTDIVPLGTLGNLNVRRATFVEFSILRQEWLVTLPEGDEIFASPNRQIALDWERKYCEGLLEEGFRPK